MSNHLMSSLTNNERQNMLANRLKTKMTGAYTELGSVESVIYDNRTERILRVTKSVQIDEIIFEVPFPLLVTSLSFNTLIQQSNLNNEHQEHLNSMLLSRESLKKQVLLLLHANCFISSVEKSHQDHLNQDDTTQKENARTDTATTTESAQTAIAEHGDTDDHLPSYLQTLPNRTDFAHLPLNWSQDRINAFGPLISQMLQSFVDRFNTEIQSLYDELIPVVQYLEQICPELYPDLNIFNKDFVQWSMCNTNSRSFDLNAYAVDQNDKELPYLPGLVPFIDLCNHNFDASIKISVERRNGERAVIARATKDLRKGDELCLNYHGSLQEVIHYLFYYGFVPNVNVQHIMYFHTTFDLTIVPEDEKNEKNSGYKPLRSPHADVLLDALEAMGLPRTDQFALPAVVDDPLPPAWIYLLRFKEMWKESQLTNDYTALIDVGKGKGLKLKAIHEENARKCLKTQVNDSLKWYLDASLNLSQKNDSEASPDDLVLHKMYTVALEVLKKSKEKCDTDEF